ncbi:hypothetical protein GCM10009623_18040 [Nocardioides aestuarii]
MAGDEEETTKVLAVLVLVRGTHPPSAAKWRHEFNPRTRRAKYPSCQTVYWDAAADAKPE